MPEFPVSVKLIINENILKTFGGLTGGVNQFGKTGTRSIKSVDQMFRRTTRDVSLFGRVSSKTFAKVRSSARGLASEIKSIGQSTEQLTRRMSRLQSTFSRGRGRIGGVLGGVTPGILAADAIRAGARAAVSIPGFFVTEAAKVERATTQFRILTGSVKLATDTVEKLRTLSAVTPFQFEDLAAASRLLLAMRATTLDKLIPTLRMLGDTAGGSSDQLLRISFAFGESIANSKATLREIRQFVNAGIPLLAFLAEQWGVTIQQAAKMVTQGRATGKEVTKVFVTMTSEGGLFFKGMELASKDFFGRLSTLTDNIKITAATIGFAFLPRLKEYILIGIDIAKQTNEWALANKDLITAKFISGLETAKNILNGILPIIKAVGIGFKILLPVLETMAPILPVLAAGWLANKAALGALALGNVALLIGKVVISLRAAATAQGIWNVLALANPYTAIITGAIIVITALVAGIVLVVKNWDFLVGKMKEGIFKIVGVFTFMLAPFIRIFSRISGALASLFGFDELAEDLKGIEKDFDALQRRLREKAGIKVFKVDPAILKEVNLVEKFLNLPKKQTGAPLGFPGIPFAFGDVKPPASPETESPTGRRRGLGGGFQIPRLETVSKQIVEHVIKLNVSGLPAGATLSVDTGGEAPPIEVSVLGEQ